MGEKGRFGTGRGTLAAGREELARRLRLTLVISGEEARPRTIGELAEKAFAGGATALQLREKSLAGREHYGLARDLAAFCRERGRLFIVNDRLDLALASGADGLHLGQGDLPARVARAHWPEGKILGISASTVGEARAAREAGADYVGVGAIFRTGSKSEAGEVARDQIGPINSLGLVTVAIGGIGQGNAALVWSMGFDGLAVISALARAADPEGTARAIMAARPA